MASSVEFFELDNLRHVRSHSLGSGRGSLTWLDWHAGSWWATFANYEGRGGEPGRGTAYTSLVRMDRDFREQEAWLFPASVLARFSPFSSSGGAWAADGHLYVTGHDKPELYALRLPQAGSSLIHVATFGLVTHGQAIDWDPREARLLWAIDRQRREVVAAEVPRLNPREP
jgi:hypothetical protein